MAMSSAETHAFGRKALAAAWPQVTGREASLAELQIAGAQAHLESGYGRAAYKNKTTGESAVLNNWGAVQCGHGPPCGADCFEVTDTHADGTPYNYCYKRYPTPEAGAAHLVQHMTVKRPTSWEHMQRGDIDAWAVAMRTKDPVTGTGLYFEQSADGRAKGIELRVNEIAQALGEPLMAKRGGPATTGDSAPGSSTPSKLKRGAFWGLLAGTVAAVVSVVVKGRRR